MIITVTELTQEFTKSGAEYVKVKGTTPDGQESTKSIFSNLKDSWTLLEVGATLDFSMEKKGDFWNVVAIKSVGQKAVEWADLTGAEKATPQPVKPAQPSEIIKQTVISGVEKGLWWKEVGENFRAGIFKKDDKGSGTYLWREYIKQMLVSLEIKIEVKKEVAKEEIKSPLVEAAKKMGATEIKPEELPF